MVSYTLMLGNVLCEDRRWVDAKMCDEIRFVWTCPKTLITSIWTIHLLRIFSKIMLCQQHRIHNHKHTAHRTAMTATSATMSSIGGVAAYCVESVWCDRWKRNMHARKSLLSASNFITAWTTDINTHTHTQRPSHSIHYYYYYYSCTYPTLFPSSSAYSSHHHHVAVIGGRQHWCRHKQT